MAPDLAIATLVVVASELAALVIVFRLWRSDDVLLFKIVLSVLALIPVFGPILVLWIGNWPNRQHPALRDRFKGQADVHERWRDVFTARSPIRRFHQCQQVMEREQQLADEDATRKPAVPRSAEARPVAVWWLFAAILLGVLLGLAISTS